MQVLLGIHQYETPGIIIEDATWDDIINLCETRRHIVRARDDKWKSGWVSPAILYAGAASRKASDVERMAAWFGGDFDHANWTLPELLERFGSMQCIIYSTTRSTARERRWRVLTPLSRETTPAEFAGVWRALNSLLGGEIDAQTKNLNRLHYLPAAWIGGNNEFHVQDGDVLDVDALLEICPPEAPVYYTEVFELDGVHRPDGIDIITPAMIQRHMIGKGGGRFIKLLCAAATYHKAKGWTLSASELSNAALQVSPVDSSGLKRAMSAYREAERALSYINSRVETVDDGDRLLATVKWKYGVA